MKAVVNNAFCAYLLSALLAASLCFGCANPITSGQEITPDTPENIDDAEDDDAGSGKTDAGQQYNVLLKVVGYEDTEFSPTGVSGLAESFGRVDVQVFNESSERVKELAFKSGEVSLDSLKLKLDEGLYQIVIIAHNGGEAPTFSSPEKITFPNNKVTDTLYKYMTLAVGSSTIEQDVMLTRAVAMFRLNTTDEKPADVATIKFYYTGGSSTFNAVSGYGSVNSRQTELRDVSAVTGTVVCGAYTFPHDETGQLDITITSLDAQGNELKSAKIEDADIARNMITEISAGFFSSSQDSSDSSPAFTFSIGDGGWNVDNRNLR